MICLQQNADNTLSVITPQPTTTTACTLVAVSPNEIGASPFALTLEEAQLIAASILGCWAIGFIFRELARVLTSGDETNEQG